MNDNGIKAFNNILCGAVVMNELLDRIVVDPKVMTGKPVIKGTRITVDNILELLAAGMKPEEVAEEYNISLEDIRAALLYAAKVLSREEIIVGART